MPPDSTMPRRTPGRPRLAYRVDGDEGTPVLMVMGFGMRGVVWRPQVATLEQAHQVITFDHRGVGDSEADPGWPTMETLRDDALRVADAAGIDRFHLVGVSMGGMVAQHLALRAPQRLHSLSLVVTQAGGPLAWLPTPRGIARFLRVQRAKTPDARARAMERLLFTDRIGERVDAEAMRRRRADTSPPAPRATLLRQLHAIVRHRTHHRLHELQVPTLVVGARHDHLVRPSHSHHLAAAIDGARFVQIGSAGHGLIFEQADALNRELLGHLSAHEPHAGEP